MKRKLANILIRVFMGLWILLSIVMLIVLLSKGKFQVNKEYIYQVLIAIGGSIWIGTYIWKNSKS